MHTRLFAASLLLVLLPACGDKGSVDSRAIREREDFVFLGIDEGSMGLRGVDITESGALALMAEQWPWNSAVWAAAIERLGEAGARMIVLDLLFSEQTLDPEADAYLAETIGKHRDRVILVSFWLPKPNYSGNGELVGEIVVMQEPGENFLGPLDDETAFGYGNFWAGEDGVFRDTVYRMSLREAQNPPLERHPDEHVYDSLAGAMARKMGVAPPDGETQIRFATENVNGKERGDVVYAPISLYKVFAKDSWEGEFESGAFFKDKIVIIGPAAAIFQGTHATPVGEMTGSQLHLQALGSLLASDALDK